MRRIAVLTSGGDAPGMNAAVRAVVRAGIWGGFEVFGVRDGYAGLIAGRFERLGTRQVSGILQTGGTFLGSARCEEFYEEQGRREAITQLETRGVDALVVVGGNGSQSGSHALSQTGVCVVGIASTIDNDLVGTDVTIGVDSAVNVAVEAVDRLKVTAASHRRAFVVETMGRTCGYVALMAGIAGGAEVVSIPEAECSPDEIAHELRAAYDRGKNHALVVVAEGAQYDAMALVSHFAKNEAPTGFSMRATILGHVQRGAAPTFADRLLATRLGEGAIRSLQRGECGVLVGVRGTRVITTPLADVVGVVKPLDLDLVALGRAMAL